MKDRIGVIHGRFQMLHQGHMEYLLEGKKRCDYLLIGIANPDISLTKYSDAAPHRSSPLANPLTYFERFQMIRGSMLENGIALQEFDIVPFPINYPKLLGNYVPIDAKFYITIYDEWGIRKKEVLEQLGCSVEVMWERTDDERFTSGTEVRDRIAKGATWENLVPQYVSDYVKRNKIDLRIRNLAAAGGTQSAEDS